MTGAFNDIQAIVATLVAVFEKYPVLQPPEWRLGQAIDTAAVLDTLEPSVAEALVEMIEQPGVPTPTAIKIIRNVAKKTKRDQRAIAALYRSNDDEKITLAKARAAGVPPMPPPSLPLLNSAIQKIKIAIEKDSTVEKAELANAIKILEAVLKANEHDYQELRRQEGW